MSQAVLTLYVTCLICWCPPLRSLASLNAEMALAPAEIVETTRPAISRPDIVTTSVISERELSMRRKRRYLETTARITWARTDKACRSSGSKRYFSV